MKKLINKFSDFLVLSGVALWVIETIYFLWLEGWHVRPNGPLEQTADDIVLLMVWTGLALQFVFWIVFRIDDYFKKRTKVARQRADFLSKLHPDARKTAGDLFDHFAKQGTITKIKFGPGYDTSCLPQIKFSTIVDKGRGVPTMKNPPEPFAKGGVTAIRPEQIEALADELRKVVADPPAAVKKDQFKSDKIVCTSPGYARKEKKPLLSKPAIESLIKSNEALKDAVSRQRDRINDLTRINNGLEVDIASLKREKFEAEADNVKLNITIRSQARTIENLSEGRKGRSTQLGPG